MKKSISISNDFCPQSLFLYGTYKEDNTPNFGLFGWFSYCYDSGLSVMACIGGKKLTRDRINATKVFSANLVTEDFLPVADYLGNKEGYSKDKMNNIKIDIEKGQVLDVPILTKSPFIFELSVSQSIVLDDSEVFICKINNVLADEYLYNEDISVEERIKTIRPVHTACSTYFSWSGNAICPWGDAVKNI